MLIIELSQRTYRSTNMFHALETLFSEGPTNHLYQMILGDHVAPKIAPHLVAVSKSSKHLTPSYVHFHHHHSNPLPGIFSAPLARPFATEHDSASDARHHTNVPDIVAASASPTALRRVTRVKRSGAKFADSGQIWRSLPKGWKTRLDLYI